MHIKKSILDILSLIKYVIRMGLREGFSNPFKSLPDAKGKQMYILANGPSLKDFLKIYDDNQADFSDKDFFVVNDFVKDSHFKIIKPRYCAMSDPLFFIETIYSERGHKAMESIANEVEWSMILVVPRKYIHSPFLNPIKKNQNIKIIAFHSVTYAGPERIRNWFYSKGLGNGEFGTVVLNAIYTSIQCGYNEIYLYGIDHTFFDNVTVNQKNELCYRDSHFYERDSMLRPMLNHYNGINFPTKPFKMSEFLYEKANLFKGHEIMNKYANHVNCKVYNCTPNSLVDEYERKIVKNNK